jgi:histidinol dehydrogenase
MTAKKFMKTNTITKNVSAIIDSVRKSGDKALVDFARRFDKVNLSPAKIRIPKERIAKAPKLVDPMVRRALDECARRIREFHYQEKKHAPSTWSYTKNGVRLGQFYAPMSAVGIYVPGGRFSYPSTVLMTAIPALMAGVERVAIVTPPARLSDEILAAAQIAGVTEIYQMGGPAAVAALALGTKTIVPVDIIVGPGNALVTEAKRQLFGSVGIDLLAGPSELVVVADDSAPADFVAADMAAQAEHDPDSRSILISLSKELVKQVKRAIPAALLKQCDLVYEPSAARAAERANAFAGEHVQIILRHPHEILDRLKNGGAFFLGAWSPAVMGDYWAGPSHVLPTDRSARFASGLSVMTFLKRSSFMDISSGAFQKGAPAALAIAEKEGLVQHANALRLRQNTKESS